MLEVQVVPTQSLSLQPLPNKLSRAHAVRVREVVPGQTAMVCVRVLKTEFPPTTRIWRLPWTGVTPSPAPASLSEFVEACVTVHSGAGLAKVPGVSKP